MRALYFFISVVLFSNLVNSQNITINESDMTIPNIYNVSKMNDVTFNPDETGQNYEWDFSFMQFDTQVNDTFFSVSDAPYVYQAVYNNPLDQDHKATVVQSTGNISNMVTAIQITDNYDYFKNASSRYVKVGVGSSINGVPTAMKYDDVEIVVGDFPLLFNHVTSSVSVASADIPSIGYYGQTIDRSNIVDGYGQLTTPYGTFETVRTKSVINIKDTLYYEAYHNGIAFDRPEVVEYNWYGDSQFIPLLTIRTTAGGNYAASYKDSVRLTTQLNAIDNNFKTKIYPTITSDKINVELNCTNYNGIEIIIVNEMGVTLYHEITQSVIGKNIKSISLKNKIKTSGIYFVYTIQDSNINVKRVVFRK